MTLQRTIALALLLGSVLAPPGAALAQGQLKPGEWEATSSTEIPGSYTGPIERTDRRCYNSADQKIYADEDAWAADRIAATGKCEARDLQADGTALSVTLVCDGGRRVKILHDFRGDNGTMDTQSFDGDEPGARARYTLKRVADVCSPETIELWKEWHAGQEYTP